MKFSEDDRLIERSGNMTEMEFGISAGDTSHILGILRDRLYTDKILAVVREYATNAIDANVENGNGHIPIEIEVPTVFSPVFSIRDFGTGLSENEIRTIYTQYGASTKRGSNNSIGQLGIGCKSGFAYADNFTITSFHGGMKTIYTAYLDESNSGKVAKLSSVPSKEKTGLMISLSVNANDVTAFHERIQRTCQFFAVRPKFSGKEVNFPKRNPVFFKDDWKLYDDSNGCNAIMGSIAYPIDMRVMDSMFTGKYHNCRFVMLSCDMYFEIGELEIAANREGLEYKDKTKKAIFDKAVKIVSYIENEAVKEIAALPTLIEAQKQFYALQNRFSFMRNSVPSIQWRGCNVSGKIFDMSYDYYRKTWTDRTLATRHVFADATNTDDGDKLHITQCSYSNRYKTTRYDSQSIEILHATRQCKLVFLDDNKAYKKRIEHFLESNRDVQVILFEATGKLKDLFWKQFNLDKYDVINVSSLPLAPKVVKPRVKRTTTKYIKKAFIFTKPSSAGGRGYYNSDWFVESEVDISVGGVYVDIDRFLINVNGSGKTPNSIHRLLEGLKTLDIDIKQIHAFKSAMAKTLDPKLWTELSAEIKKQFPKAQKIIDRIMMHHETKSIHPLLKVLKGTPLIESYASRADFLEKNKVDLKKIDEDFRGFGGTYYGIGDAIHLLDEILGNKKYRECSPGNSLEKISTEIQARYPIIRHMIRYGGHDQEIVKEVQEYIYLKEKKYEYAAA